VLLFEQRPSKPKWDSGVLANGDPSARDHFMSEIFGTVALMNSLSMVLFETCSKSI